jgi:hypothetical protein
VACSIVTGRAGSDRGEHCFGRSSIADPPRGNGTHARQIAADAELARAGDVDRRDAELSEVIALASRRQLNDGLEQPLGCDHVDQARGE